MLRKNWKTVLCLLLCMGFLTGCAAAEKENSYSTENTVTFTDALGREVTVAQPQRTAALLGSFAEIWCLAGGEICASADDAWDDFELELPEGTVNLGKTKELSLEKLFEAEPDFVIASANTRINLEWRDTLEAAAIPTAYFDVADFDDYLAMLKICTDITGRKELYEKNGLEIQKQVETVMAQSRERIEKTGETPTVLVLRASASSIRAKNSVGNVLGEMLYSLGCINIADDDDTLLENLSIERIIQADPDEIFFVQLGDDSEGAAKNIENLLEDPMWAELTAVKEGRVHIMDKRLYNLKPNARWGEAYEKLEQILAGE
ncbi:MAG: ABC transporter substrate-binding protein [Ruminococcaceae bacterium]|nr:ABC transporter substrate-binding protein [Oscillospiraceae bacterium]